MRRGAQCVAGVWVLSLALGAGRLVAQTPTPTAAGRAVHGTTTTIESAGNVLWQEMVDSDRRRRRASSAGGEPEVVPIMPAPPARDFVPGSSTASSAPQRARAPTPFAIRAERLTSAPSLADGFAALGDNNTRIPPDTMGTVGPAHLVAILNTQVRIQDKNGGVISTVSLAAFWTTPPSTLSGNPFDPRIVYDQGAERWVATSAANSSSPASAVWLAISDGSDPTGAWKFLSIKADTAPTPTTWADFPAVGLNQTWIAITANMFTIVGSGLVGVKMWVVDKAAALAPAPLLTVTEFETGFDETTLSLGPPPTPGLTFGGFTLQPALTFGNEAKLFLVDNPLLTLIDDGGNTKLLRLSEISGTGAAPVWSPTAGSPFLDTNPMPGSSGLFSSGLDFNPNLIGAEQMGVAPTCSGGPLDGQSCLTSDGCLPPPSTPTPVPPAGACRRVDTGDSRLQNAVFRNGTVWTTHAAGLPAGAVANRTSVFWYQLDPTALAAAPVVQSGILDGGAGVHHYYPSVAVNRNDDVCFGFSRSSAATFIEAVVSGRLGSDPPGATDPITVLKAGEGPYFKTGSRTRNRWGDYSSTSVDPTDDTTLWTIQEYAAAPVEPTPGSPSDRWGTWWGRKIAPTSTSTPTQTSTPTPTMPPDMAGSVLYYREDRPVPGVTVMLVGDPMASTVTTAGGEFAFPDVQGSLLLRPEKLGDFGDGISSLDAAFAAQRVVGQRTFDLYQEFACDVTGNGALSSLDVARIRQLRVGMIDRFEVALACGSDWLFLPMAAPAANQAALDPQIAAGSCTLGSISYDPLQPPAADQDFVAVLFGDCTGNWQPDQE